MTIIEFLDLPAKDKKQYCVNHNITSHHHFSDFGSKQDTLDEFCKALDLDKGYMARMQCFNEGSYCRVYIYFNFPFQKHVDNSLPRSAGNEIIFYVEGANMNTLKISEPSIKEQVYIWAQRNNFFDSRDNYNDFHFSIYAKNKKTLSDTIKNLEQRANAYFPHIEYCLSAINDGSYEKAYNSMNNNKFVVGNTIMESFNFAGCIYTRYEAYNKFKTNLNILDCMLVLKYLQENKRKIDEIKQIADINAVINTYKEKYVINDIGESNKKKLEDASAEFKIRLQDVVTEISEKYGIHKSYFIGTDWCKVKMPTTFNNIDLTKPF